MSYTSKHTGKIVMTKSNKMGYTKNDDIPVNGKIPVYLSKPDKDFTGGKILCDPVTLKIIGYYD